MAGRTTVVASVVVDRPPAEVFAYVADVARHGEWSPRPYRVEGIEVGEQIAVGRSYTSYGWLPNDKDHRNDVEVTEVTAPTRLVLTSTERGEQFVNTFTLSAQGSGTRLERLTDMPQPGGLLGLVFPVIRALVIKPDVNKGLGTLKSLLEKQV